MQERFGKLIAEIPEHLSRGSQKKIPAKCDCGREKLVTIRYLTHRLTSSCGRCNELSLERTRLPFGALTLETPRALLPSSNKREWWICECGRRVSILIISVVSGHTKSCGKCNELSESEIANMKFGSLRMKNPRAIKKGSHQKELWVCDCGKEKLIDCYSVINRLSKSCGQCTIIPAHDIAGKKFGRLTIRTPEDLHPSSTKRVVWDCDCGNETTPIAHKVLSLHTKSCGNCWTQIQDSFKLHQEQIRGLTTPIYPHQIPKNFPQPLEPITHVSHPYKAVCQMCKTIYYPRWDGVRLGKSLTCGCTTNRVSTGHKEIQDFITSLNIEVKSEYKLDGFAFDIFVPSKNLIIEFNGLLWHTGKEAAVRDYRKYETATRAGMSYLSVFEDEWEFNRPKVEQLIRNRLVLGCPRSVRPQKCEIRKLTSQVADEFYEASHYIGKARAAVNYGVFFDDICIGCQSFKHPTRQSTHPWELIRMTSHPDYRVHGIWSKLLKIFIEEYDPSSIVSFSDNRLFQGGVYEKIGFEFDGDVRPDYYWWKNKKRFHKSGLRKTKEEKFTGKTESELREAQGYKRIWDLGKKRWVYWR